MSRRTSRSRVLVTGEIGPGMAWARRAPRAMMARSTSCASPNVTISVAIAVMVLRSSAQNEAAMGRSSAGMGVQAIARRRLGPARAEALRSALLTVFWTRLLVLVVAVAAVAIFGVHAGNEASFDRPGLTHPFASTSGALDTLL